jgi:hypothetical protein
MPAPPPESPEVEGGTSGSAMTIRRIGGDLIVSWTTALPTESAYQLYCDGKLAWHGIEPIARLPWPSKKCRVELVTVPIAQRHVAVPSVLPAAVKPRARLQWRSGTYQATDIAGFAVYAGTVAGGSVSYAARAGYVPYRDGTTSQGGWGAGGWNQGKWNDAATNFEWISAPLGVGTWNFAVKAVDLAGNEGSASTASVALTASPPAPQADAYGRRLRYTLNASTRVPTLIWTPGT